MKRWTGALLLVLSTAPVAVLADPVVIWARTIERETIPAAGDNLPATAPAPATPVMACMDRLTAADVTEIDLINFKVTPAAASYPECRGVPPDDISRLSAALLKLGQGIGKASGPAPQPYVAAAPVAPADPLADWLARYAGHIIGALTLAVTATVGYFTVAHTRHQMRQSQVALLDLPAPTEPAAAAAPAPPAGPRRRAGRTGSASRRTRSRA